VRSRIGVALLAPSRRACDQVLEELLRSTVASLSLLLLAGCSDSVLRQTVDAGEPGVGQEAPDGTSGQSQDDAGGEQSNTGDSGSFDAGGTTPSGDSGLVTERDGSADSDSGLGQTSPDGGNPGKEVQADAGGGVPVCTASASTCDGDQVLTCSQGQWQPGATCQYGCNAGACNTCEPGTTRCDGLDVQTCNGPGWELSQACDYLCQTGACVEKACEPNQVVCSPGQAGQQCNELGTAWGAATSCQGACKVGQADCNNAPGDGCETGTNTTNNCGGCGITCSAPGAASYCSNGTCAYSCITGKADCDGKAANGCEVTPATDVSNCGGCGVVCSSSGGTPSCGTGSCSIQCDSTHGNCDGFTSNGCETPLTTMNDCGGCGIVCDAAKEICQAGACTSVSCASGKGNCDGNSANGCETSVTTVINCGACGVQCANYPNMATSCNGSCQYACTAGFANVNGSLNDGCEVNLKTDPNNCGTVGNICSSNGGTPSCSNGACAIQCSSGRASCDGQVSNGCEVNTTSDTGNCGACGTVCSVDAHETATCSASSCVTTCQAGWDDCNGNSADGCELSVSADVSNCGGCGNICVGDTTSNDNVRQNQCNSGQCEYDVTEIWAGTKATANASAESVRTVASDGTYVYLSTLVTKASSATVKFVKVAKSGGTPSTLYTGTLAPVHLILRNGHLYWGTWDNSSGSLIYKLFKTTTSDGSTTMIFSETRGNYSPVATFAMDDSYIYWASNESTVSPTYQNGTDITSTTIYRLSINGGAATAWTTINEAAIGWADQTFPNSSSLFLGTWGSRAANQYGADQFPNQGIWQIPTANAANKGRVVGSQKSMTKIAATIVDQRSIVWMGAYNGNGGVWSYQPDGSYKSLYGSFMDRVFTDGSMVIIGNSGGILTTPVTGGTPTRVTPITTMQGVMTTDADSVVWAESLTNLGTDAYSVVRVAPRP